MKNNKTQTQQESEESEHRFYEAIAKIHSADEAQQFLEDLCTPAERQAMMDRWQVVASLNAGTPYRNIHDDTGVSVTTIGRVARCMRFGTGGYNLIYKRVTKNEKRKTYHRNTKKRAPQ